MRLDEHAQPGGVDELELSEIDDHQLAVSSAIELGLEFRARGDVELSGQREYHAWPVFNEIDSEVRLQLAQIIACPREGPGSALVWSSAAVG